MRSALPPLPTRWPLPLLVALIAACGGGGGTDSASLQPPSAVLLPLLDGALTLNNTAGSDGSSTQSGLQPAPPPSPVPTTGADTTTPAATAPSATPTPAPAPATSYTSTYTSLPGCEVKYTSGPLPTQRTGADPRQSEQWYLHNAAPAAGMLSGEDLNLQPLWTGDNFLGEGIRVAIIDDAIDVLHEDLLPNVAPAGSYDYRVSTKDGHYPVPCRKHETHGTAVAGLIAARDDNGVGIRGIAPRASLVGLNALANEEDQNLLDALGRDADKNHIYNNSWGSPDSGDFHSTTLALSAAISSGLKHGRGGLGSIYVFAAGNGGCLKSTSSQACQGTDLSTYDGTVSLLGALPICATNAAGKRASYSEPGANLLVCAPSAAHDGKLPDVSTTYIQNTYTDGFGGTSAAAPMASGVIALMLQANPKLTWRDVRLVLARSARKVDPSHAGWRSHDRLNFNHEYGFGVIDADAAVKLARTWHSVGGSDSMKTCVVPTQGVQQSIPEQARPDTAGTDYNARASGGLSSTLQVPSDCGISKIEHIALRIKTQRSATQPNAEHPDTANLHITLTSPSGQTSTLATPHACVAYSWTSSTTLRDTCTGLQHFEFGISRHLDEPAIAGSNRNWTLELVDRGVGNGRTGQLASWSMTIYGR